MKMKLIAIGKTDEAFLVEGIEKYIKRLKHYVSFEIMVLNDVKTGKKLNIELQKDQEGRAILEKVQSNETLILLDENGKDFTSVGFANFLQKKLNAGNNLVFVIGGPFGFSTEVYQRADAQLALSKLTFSHQMVRLFFVEQLYRAFTIIKGEKYHHL